MVSENKVHLSGNASFTRLEVRFMQSCSLNEGKHALENRG
jgi:hypothetical protein